MRKLNKKGKAVVYGFVTVIAVTMISIVGGWIQTGKANEANLERILAIETEFKKIDMNTVNEKDGKTFVEVQGHGEVEVSYIHKTDSEPYVTYKYDEENNELIWVKLYTYTAE